MSKKDVELEASRVAGEGATLPSGKGRIVSHFSCGAASAISTMLTIAQYGHERVVILNAFIVEEDDDNRRFLTPPVASGASVKAPGRNRPKS